MFWHKTWTNRLVILGFTTLNICLPCGPARSLASHSFLLLPLPGWQGSWHPPLAGSAFYVPVGPKIQPSSHSDFLLILLLDNAKLSKDDQVPGLLNLNSLRPLPKHYFKTLKTKGPGVSGGSVNFTKIRWHPDPWQPHAPPHHHLSSTRFCHSGQTPPFT